MMIDASNIEPTPPNLIGLNWRPISRDDLAALVDLAGTCLLTDGGLSFLFVPEILIARYFPETPGSAIGAFTQDGQLVASAAVHLSGETDAHKAILIGQVRPDYRSQGIGAYLLRWSHSQAGALLSVVPASQQVLQIATESLTEPAHRLYRAHGFENVFAELVMKRDLLQPLPDRLPPPEVTFADWHIDLASQFYQAYHAAFRERPGFPGWSAEKWISQVTEDDLVPEWSLLAQAGNEPLGFVIGTIDSTAAPPGGYIWQVGVIPSHRRRGLVSALMTESMRRMQADGATMAQLTVHLNNLGAIEAYTRLGFTTVGRRARYERIAHPG